MEKATITLVIENWSGPENQCRIKCVPLPISINAVIVGAIHLMTTCAVHQGGDFEKNLSQLCAYARDLKNQVGKHLADTCLLQ